MKKVLDAIFVGAAAAGLCVAALALIAVRLCFIGAVVYISGIAWLARLNPWRTVAVAIFFAAMINGGFALQTSGVPAAIAYMLQALVLFSVLVGDFFVTHHLVRRRGHDEAVAPREARAEP